MRLEFYGYPANYLETYKAALEKVTLADVNAAARKYIHPDKLAVLVVGNGPEIKPPLDDLGMGAPHPIDITIPQPQQPAGPGEQAVSKKQAGGQPKESKLAVVIMAAGKGTRLKSRRPKVLHQVGGSHC